MEGRPERSLFFIKAYKQLQCLREQAFLRGADSNTSE